MTTTIEGAAGENESVEPREAGAPGARQDHPPRPARLLGAWRDFARWATALPGMLGERRAYCNPLCNGNGQGHEPRPQALGRQGDERSGAASPLSGGASGGRATGEIPEARRPALAPATLARGRGRLVELQGEYRDWLDTLPPSLEDSVTAEALRAICDLDLSELESVEPPRGFGRD